MTLGAMATALTGDVVPAQTPRISKPIQIPTSKMPPLPPAVFDDTLAIGGQDIKARTVSTRMTVEVPSNMMMKRTRPALWIPFIMVCWGVCTTLMGEYICAAQN